MKPGVFIPPREGVLEPKHAASTSLAAASNFGAGGASHHRWAQSPRRAPLHLPSETKHRELNPMGFSLLSTEKVG